MNRFYFFPLKKCDVIVWNPLTILPHFRWNGALDMCICMYHLNSRIWIFRKVAKHKYKHVSHFTFSPHLPIPHNYSLHTYHSCGLPCTVCVTFTDGGHVTMHQEERIASVISQTWKLTKVSQMKPAPIKKVTFYHCCNKLCDPLRSYLVAYSNDFHCQAWTINFAKQNEFQFCILLTTSLANNYKK